MNARLKKINISENKSFITYDLIILCFLSHIFFILSAWIFKQTIKTDAYYCSYKNMNCTFQVSSEALNILAMTERPLEICPNGLIFDLYSKVISDMTLTAFLCFAENDSCCSINKYASLILSYICKMALLFVYWLFIHCGCFRSLNLLYCRWLAEVMLIYTLTRP